MKFSYIGALCVFMTLIAAAQCTTCKECWVNSGTKCCEEKNITCEGKCMTISEYCNKDNKEYPAIQKTCGDDRLCNKCFSATTGLGFEVRASTQCAKGDGSNANLNFTKSCGVLSPNGKECPKCYIHGSAEGCADNGTVACVGEEFECADYAGEVQYADGTFNQLSFKSCIVTGGCKVAFAVLPGSKELSRLKFNCVNATDVVPPTCKS
ncbi:uncharacterized protein LOC142107805 [Mixophyes fleayi]|uniref:uncharacterized protein LOC142107805 n=1 Tax=Mixophyes fleayi TaxID=3061075 RepID=UPI003F4E1B6A